ncbi:ankyrin repeat domain-containing protein [Curvibacter sp. APW13]|uniref:ankyrin repeat domain-containing protein n=1 Tax=Curvibacter sp. APW13 TaxID=3077236 RepID=UPI0028DEFCCE|nr:ankyrin repeat domain-containing protein [Curvibacter sp. APW13]MDT8990993.1 ankyrin repeat domain-containing protein [Curvibacter sp. APW13]
MSFTAKMGKYTAALGFAFFSTSTFAQQDMGIERAWPPVSCHMDLDWGVGVTASPLFKGAMLSGITLAFAHDPEKELRLRSKRIAFFALPEGKPIQPTAERKLAPVSLRSDRVTEAVEFDFPTTRSTKNIAIAFGESSISLRFGDRKESIDTRSRSSRLMDVASQINAPRVESSSFPCPEGISGWKAKEPLEKRIGSQDPAVGLEAAEEVVANSATMPSRYLLYAAYHLWKDGRAEEAARWLAAGVYREGYSGSSGVAYGFLMAATQPIVDYARGRSPLWAESLRQAVKWDDLAYQQWEDEQDEISKNRPTWLKKRAYQREDTLAYAQQLTADPKAPPLNPICPICPANPLRQALEEGKTEDALKILRDQKIDLNRKYPYESSYLHLASSRGHLELIGTLIDRGANREATDELGSTPLGWARDVKTIQALLDRGANVNALQGLDRQTLLMRLISNGTQQGLMKDERAEANARIALLLKAGADTNLGDSYGRTPLHVAAARGDEALMELLLEHGADINAATTTGRDRELANTPLALAKDLATARYLIKKGASLKPSRGDAPLLYAVKGGTVEVVKLLLEIGSDPNSIGGESKFNALYYAIARRDAVGVSMAELLIKNGAAPDAIVNGNSLVGWSKRYGNEPVVKLLLQAGAK